MIFSRTIVLLASMPLLAAAFVAPQQGGIRRSDVSTTSTTRRYSAPPKKQTVTVEEEVAPAGIGGADFFGGSKEKEEFFDPVAEEEAGAVIDVEGATAVNRFFAKNDRPSAAFDSLASARLAASLQSQISSVLYEKVAAPNTDYAYAHNLNWSTPLSKKSGTPMAELQAALTFYKEIDAAIVSGKQLGENTYELNWELSCVWPTFWSPRVLLFGSSTVKLDGTKIVQQTDQLIDNVDALSTIGNQIKPRFWDWYHVGMVPSTELMPQLNLKKGIFANYQTYEIPSRWVATPSVSEVGNRDDRNAQTIPNHAFTCIIKTMGPTRQRYVPTSPVQVQLIPGDERLKLQWTIPLAVEFQAYTDWPLPGEDTEALPESNPECSYEFQLRRKVATVPYGGNSQDKEIENMRKKLYEQVMKDGLKPKLDENGRPVFFFLQNTVKACYTEEGLGMCVYEWRPKMVKPNEVGIELEIS
jgi:hypothetical protein